MEKNVKKKKLKVAPEMNEREAPKPTVEQAYDTAKDNLMGAMQLLQTQLDNYAKANDNLANTKELSIQFFTRANVGQIIENFTKLGFSIYDYNQKLVQALNPAAAPKSDEVKSEATSEQ